MEEKKIKFNFIGPNESLIVIKSCKMKGGEYDNTFEKRVIYIFVKKQKLKMLQI